MVGADKLSHPDSVIMHEGARRDHAMSYVQPTRKVYPVPYPHECPQVIPARYTLDTCNLGLAPGTSEVESVGGCGLELAPTIDP